MRRISKSRIARARRLRERFVDGHGVCFDEYRLWLPDKVSDWPQVTRVDDPQVPRDYHEWWCTCWNCEEPPAYTKPVDFHHLTGGTKGRSDEYCNGCMLCRECHDLANTNELPFARLLYLKWKFDRQHVSWVRLALLRGSHLPDLITD